MMMMMMEMMMLMMMTRNGFQSIRPAHRWPLAPKPHWCGWCPQILPSLGWKRRFMMETINESCWVPPQEIGMQLWDGVDQRSVNKSRPSRIQAWWIERSSIVEMFQMQCYICGMFCFVNDFEQPTSSPVTLAIFCPVTSSMVRPILPTCKFCFKCSKFQHQVYWVYYLFTLSQGYIPIKVSIICFIPLN